ncbi:MaoC family dehydratase [Rhodovibrionaceae bacterium A322]
MSDAPTSASPATASPRKPGGDYFFDDFEVGQVFTTRGATLTEAQILDFAWTYDPQPFHLDKVAAEDWGYGGLIASGFQTLAVGFRLFYQEKIINACSLGSPGLDELRWLKPVRPGDTLHVVVEVLELRASRSKPDRGIAVLAYETRTQSGDAVLTYRCTHIFRRNPELVAQEGGA